MTTEAAIKAYVPMTETMYYILLSLTEPKHGYGIMLNVADITKGRIRIRPGTVYNSLARLEQDGLISIVAETDRKKIYIINNEGLGVLKTEIVRLGELFENGRGIYG